MTKTLSRHDAVKALADSLGKPSLHGLSYALRHPETWPEGFVWDFARCDKCAMGLAYRLWTGKSPIDFENGNDSAAANNRKWSSYSARTFAMPLGEAERIFLNTEWTRQQRTFLGIPAGRTPSLDLEDVTPEMVADEIDRYLTTSE